MLKVLGISVLIITFICAITSLAIKMIIESATLALLGGVVFCLML